MGLDVRVHLLDSELNLKKKNYLSAISDWDTKWVFYPEDAEQIFIHNMTSFSCINDTGYMMMPADEIVSYAESLMEEGYFWWTIVKVEDVQSLNPEVYDTQFAIGLNKNDYLFIMGDLFR